MDVRVTPTPADLPVISSPGMFDGWGLSIELDPGQVYGIRILKTMGPGEVADQLRRLAFLLDEGGQCD